eukprot:m.46632 g.46632  ORF g.46632 m.46632 type:complete len:200 (-) comp12261_c0_seq1:129-728(-)
MSYFDIDDILMQEEKLPCVSSIDIIKMGGFDSSSDTPYLKKGAKVEIPLWLIKNYREKNGEDVFEVNPPKFLNANHSEMLKADASVINLQAWCPHFFTFAITYFSLFPDNNAVETVIKAFSERYRVILDVSQNAIQDDTSEKTRRLDHLERRLFAAGLQDDKAQQLWLRREAHRIHSWPGARKLDLLDGGHLTKRAKAA